MTLGERLRALRRTSRAQVAAAAGISVSHLERLERGKSDCTTAVALALAKALGVPVEALLRPCDASITGHEHGGAFLALGYRYNTPEFICTRGGGHDGLHRDDRYGVSW